MTAFLAVLAAATPTHADSNNLAAIAFAGVDFGKRSTFAALGGKLLYPVGEFATTFVMADLGMSLSDLRKAGDGKITNDAVAAHARLLFGAERSFGPLFASLAIGPSINSWEDRTGRARQRAGIAAHGALWYRPTNVDVFSVTSVVDSGPRSYWVRLRYGRSFAALPFVIGPEAAFSHSRTTHKVQTGAHLSDWMLGRISLSLSGGWMWERGKPGPYMTASAYVKY